jgi:hypothetical protein
LDDIITSNQRHSYLATIYVLGQGYSNTYSVAQNDFTMSKANKCYFILLVLIAVAGSSNCGISKPNKGESKCVNALGYTTFRADSLNKLMLSYLDSLDSKY